jgi:magnesium transporter
VGEWIDLLDPDEETVRARVPFDLHPTALEQLTRPGGEPRPGLDGHGEYIFGVLLVAVAVPEEDRVYYQEVDLVLTHDVLVTVRKTPPGEDPFEIADTKKAVQPGERAATCAFRLMDAVAERFLGLIDAVNDEIDELEDHVDDWEPEVIRKRISELRHDILRIRRTLAPTRDAVHRIVDGRLMGEAPGVLDRDITLHFGDVYDKLLQATDALELSRDLLAGVRDYHQAKIANDVNEVMKRLTAIASILLVPTLIVGVYGQNFENMPELRWRFGYGGSWALIIAVTVAQVWYFRRKRWI